MNVTARTVKYYVEKEKLVPFLQEEIDICNSTELNERVQDEDNLNHEENVIILKKVKKKGAISLLSDQKAVELQLSSGLWGYSEENLKRLNLSLNPFTEIFKKVKELYSDFDSIKEESIMKNAVITMIFMVYLKSKFASKMNEIRLIYKKSENALNNYFGFDEDIIFDFIEEKLN